MGMESAHKDENKRKGRGGENHMHKSEVYLFPTESLVRQDRVFTLVHRMLKGSSRT